MLMKIITQAACILLALVCTGQAIKPNTTKLDKVLYVVTGFAYVFLCFWVQGVL